MFSPTFRRNAFSRKGATKGPPPCATPLYPAPSRRTSKRRSSPKSTSWSVGCEAKPRNNGRSVGRSSFADKAGHFIVQGARDALVRLIPFALLFQFVRVEGF